MPTQHLKLRVIVFMCLGILVITLGCSLSNGMGYPNSLAPVRSLTLTIDKSQREDLFVQLQKFSDEHDYKLALTEYEKIEHFLVELWGDDILITASDVPPDPSLVYISFYWIDYGTQVDEEIIENLIVALKNLINEIPNVTISEGN